MPHYSSKGSLQYPKTDCQSMFGRRKTSSQPEHPADLSAPTLYLIYDNCTSEVSDENSLELVQSISTFVEDIPHSVSVFEVPVPYLTHRALSRSLPQIQDRGKPSGMYTTHVRIIHVYNAKSKSHVCMYVGDLDRQGRSVAILNGLRQAIRRRSRKHAAVDEK